jgi:hypothetical protein
MMHVAGGCIHHQTTWCPQDGGDPADVLRVRAATSGHSGMHAGMQAGIADKLQVSHPLQKTAGPLETMQW